MRYILKNMIYSMLVMIIITACCGILYADVAVLPYKVESTSPSVSEETGNQYAMLAGVAARISRGLDIYSPDMLERDMKSLSIDPRGVVDRKQLQLLGKTRYIDYIQTGTIMATGKSFKVKSILYSVARDTIVVRCEEEASTLFDLAEKETSELYFQFPESKWKGSPEGVDMVVLVDNSYNMSHEIDEVRAGIVAMADAASMKWASDTRVFVIPLIGTSPSSRGVEPATAPYSLQRKLKTLEPEKGSSVQNVPKWVSHLSRSFRWRKDALKSLCLVLNTRGVDYSVLHRYRYMLQNRGVTVNVIAGGKLHLRDRKSLQQMAASAKGAYYDITYHQRVFDLQGNAIDVFLEGGRLLHGQVPGDRWEDGVLIRRGTGTMASATPKGFVDEIFYENRVQILEPYDLEKEYQRISGKKILGSKKLEQNTERLLKMTGEKTGERQPGTGQGVIARVMLTNEEQSVWVNVIRQEDLDYFKRQKNTGNIFLLGVSPVPQPAAPYGLTFSPYHFVTGMTGQYIPGLMKVSLKDIIVRQDHYRQEGLFSPPIWFIDVKVTEIRREKGAREDIRDW